MFQPPTNASAITLGSHPSVRDVMPDRVVVINDFSSMGGGATAVALDSMRLLNALVVAVTFLTGDQGRCDLPPHIEIVALGGTHFLAGNRVGASVRGLFNHTVEHMRS